MMDERKKDERKKRTVSRFISTVRMVLCIQKRRELNRRNKASLSGEEKRTDMPPITLFIPFLEARELEQRLYYRLLETLSDLLPLV